MQELVRQITAALRGMWRFRWPGMLVAWVVAAIGMTIALTWPDKYEASARIYVDTQSILKPLMSGLAVQPNVDQQVVMLSRTLINRPNVEKVVRMADLDLKNDSKSEQEARIERLMKELEIKSAARDNLYTLAYRDADADHAKRVVQSMVSIFVESSLGASRKDTDTAKVFIDEQIKAYEAKLEAAEARLKDFRLRNIDVQIGEGRDSASRLGELSAQLEQARLDLREAEMSLESARQQLNNEKKGVSSALPDLLAGSTVGVATPEIDARIAEQKKNLDNLLQRFTDLHPDVVNTRKLIKDLEEQKRKESAELRKAAMASQAASGANSSLAVQELSRIVATTEVQAAALRARVAEYASRYAQARNTLKVAPQIEAEAAQLNRDYAITKKNYEDLVARRQSAAMSGELESTAGVADFRLIDPPRVSPKPVSPNRLALVALAVVAALAAGLVTAFVASELRPVFHQAAELREKFGLPLLGVISMAASEGERRVDRTDKMRFVAATGALLTASTAVIVATAIMANR